MSTVNAGPTINSSGLVLYLDASNPNSYPGSGNTWTDLSGNGNNATLVNSPAYSTDANGCISFNGSNNYATIPYNNFMTTPTSTTINVWYNPSSSGGGQHMVAYAKTGWIGYVIYPFGAVYSGTVGSNNFDKSISPSLSLNRWYMITFVINRENSLYNLYSNGVLNQTGSISHPVISNNASLHIGARQGPDSYYSGKISQLSYYNRALSSEEIRQNYNALKYRFGL